MARPRTPGTRRQYPRTARVNHLLQEILADALTRLDDERLALVAITGVEVDRDLRHAEVFFDSPGGEASDDEVRAVFDELRPRLQAVVNREARLRRIPTLEFRPDPGVRRGARIDEILRGLGPAEEGDDR